MTDTANFSPREIVSELDRFIVGQHDAKRAVAIALRNRWRRQQLAGGAARGGAAEEHPDDRPDRRRQDRDRAPAGASWPRRRSSRSRRPSSPRSAMSAATSSRSSATCVEIAIDDDPRDAAQGGRGQGRDRAPRSACSTRWSATAPRPRPAQKFRKMLREGELDDREIEIQVADTGGGHADLRHPRHARRPDGHAQPRRDVRQGLRRPHQAAPHDRRGEPRAC